MSEDKESGSELQKAYKAGKQAGRAELVMEMLADLKHERECLPGWSWISSGDIDTNYISAEFVLRYLPKRYMADRNTDYWPDSGY